MKVHVTHITLTRFFDKIALVMLVVQYYAIWVEFGLTVFCDFFTNTFKIFVKCFF